MSIFVCQIIITKKLHRFLGDHYTFFKNKETHLQLPVKNFLSPTFSKSHTDTVGNILELNVHRFARGQILERPNMVRLDIVVRLVVGSAVVVVVMIITVSGIVQQHIIQVARIFPIQRNRG